MTPRVLLERVLCAAPPAVGMLLFIVLAWLFFAALAAGAIALWGAL
jgi:hypothetical protein